MKERTFTGIVWGLCMPLFLYFGMEVFFSWILSAFPEALLPADSAMWILTAKNLLMLPVFVWIYREEGVIDALFLGRTEVTSVEEFQERMEQGRTRGRRIPLWELLFVILCSVFFSRAVNYLLGLTWLPRYFTGYEAVSEEIFGCSLFSQVAASVISAPLLEETLMRGIIYSRLKRSTGDVRVAIAGSALIFGIFHGNVVQGVYAFLLGLFFAWLYEAYDRLFPAIAAHMAANAASIFLEKTGWMQWVSGNVSLYYLTTAVLFLAGYLCFHEISSSRQREAKHRWKN